MEENIINENLEVDVSNNEENSDVLSNDSIALAYDYYDHYYDEVTKSLSTIAINQGTIIDNQQLLMDKVHSLNTTCSSFTFIVTLIFVYTLIRNMIITK